MKLKFDKSGRRFFFLTFCVRGRRPVLSKLISEKDARGKMTARVELAPLGERIAALWRGIHSRYPALTASNFAVMPDHVHALLIVNYPAEPNFDILDWFQHFLRECEELLAKDLGVAAEEVWEEKFWILLVNAGKPLAAVRHYIKMNPVRKAWKTENSDFFIRHANIRHAALDPRLKWTAIGNLTLLASPFMVPVRLTRKKSVAEHLPEIERLVADASRGMIPVCGFLSPGEKELERRLREESDTRWIKSVPHGLPARFDPTVEDSRFLAEGRQLVLSSFALDVPVYPVNYDNCHLMNARNEELCARANGEVDTSEAVLASRSAVPGSDEFAFARQSVAPGSGGVPRSAAPGSGGARSMSK